MECTEEEVIYGLDLNERVFVKYMFEGAFATNCLKLLEMALID